VRPHGHPALIVRLVLEQALELALDERILAEYRDVLARPKFGFSDELQRSLLAALREIAVFSGLPDHSVTLPDASDEMFVEVAMAAEADALVTGNLRHFPAEACAGVLVISPAHFMKLWTETPS
ncbi:MAG TPA: putative toxin-antitoxin system toxin component, PIN family, partial [Chloroflexota bacterium]